MLFSFGKGRKVKKDTFLLLHFHFSSLIHPSLLLHMPSLMPYTSAAGAPTAWCGNACHCQPFPLPGSLPILSPPAAACPFSCLSVPPTHHHPSKTCRLSDTHNSNTHHHHHHHHQNGQMAGPKNTSKTMTKALAAI